jgi:hypothetical protein
MTKLTGDHERQVRLLVADGASGFSNGTVASLLALIDKLRGMAELATFEQLEAQPVGAIVTDDAGIAYQLGKNNAWYMTGGEHPIHAVSLLDRGSVRLVWTPEQTDDTEGDS